MFSILGLGFLLGMQHALEADHVAAVTSLTSNSNSPRRIIAHGAIWGTGHALTLMIFGGAILLIGFQVGETTAHWLEFAVGVMLAILGGRVVISVLRERIHVHFHRHADGRAHIHAHSHKHSSAAHYSDRVHDHEHTEVSIVHLFQTLVVGIIHGMAGTTALVVLVAASSVESVSQGAIYLCLFAVGSIIGMITLTGVVVLPASLAMRNTPHLSLFVRSVIGVATMIIGAHVMIENWV